MSSVLPSALTTFTVGATWYRQVTAWLKPLRSGNATGVPSAFLGLRECCSAGVPQFLSKYQIFSHAIPFCSIMRHMECALEKQQSGGKSKGMFLFAASSLKSRLASSSVRVCLADWH